MNKMSETVTMIPVRDILPFPNHPFRITEDAQMEQLTQSIAEFGVLNPVIVRKTNEGFRMISGHRRKYACEVLEIEEIPALIRDLDDDMATILMVDSNLQREQLLPSEKALEKENVMADKPVQSFVGSRSAYENLKLIPADKFPVLNSLKESDKETVVGGLEEALDQKWLDKIWDMIWERWQVYADFCGKRR